MGPTDDQYGDRVQHLLNQDLPVTGFSHLDALLLIAALSLIMGIAISLYAVQPR